MNFTLHFVTHFAESGLRQLLSLSLCWPSKPNKTAGQARPLQARVDSRLPNCCCSSPVRSEGLRHFNVKMSFSTDEVNFLVSEHIFASSHLLLHQSDFLHLPGSYQFYHLKIFGESFQDLFQGLILPLYVLLREKKYRKM